MEKLAYALVVAARKLRQDFQSHLVTVLTDFPLKEVLQKIDASGRMVRWSVELSEFGIDYKPGESPGTRRFHSRVFTRQHYPLGYGKLRTERVEWTD